MAIDTRAYRDAVGRFVTGVTLCTTVSPAGNHGITANSFTSVSLDPLLVLISVEKVARFHDEVLGAGVFAISILSSAHEEAARRFSRRGRPETDDQFDLLAHHAGATTGCIVVDDALAVLECRLWSSADGGDHTLVVGEVMEMTMPAEPVAAPLVYAGGTFRTLP